MKKKSIRPRRKNNNARNSTAFIFVLIIGISLGIVIYNILDYSYSSLQAKKALAPMETPEDSLLKPVPAGTNDGENNIPSQKPVNNMVIFHGSRQSKRIALTFDADMTPGMEALLKTGKVKSFYDKAIPGILMSTNTKATIFLTGMWIETYPGIAKQLAENPLFELGNHSYSHPSFSGYCYGLRQIPVSRDEEEIQKTQDLLKKITGNDNKLFRFPGGCYSQNNIDIVEKSGLTVIQWDVVGEDGFNNDAVAIENNIVPKVTNGSIIVLHFNGYPNEPKTAEVLPDIILQLKARGFEFVKVSDLLGNSASSAFNMKQYLPRLYAFL